MENPAIQLTGVTYAYEDGAPAVNQVSLEITKGEYLAVVGKNGSGKSTLAKLINGLLLPDEGEVRVFGLSTREEGRMRDIRRQVGMVFQNPDNQIVASIVEEDVAFGPENLGTAPAEIRQRVQEALRAVGMWEYRRRAPHMLSGGQKQRVAIAGILAMEPAIIVFDESTSMLDPKGREDITAIMEMLNRERGITVIHITHSMEEAMMADRVLVMESGKNLMLMKPEEIFLQPVEVLVGLGLELPFAMDLSARLQREGLDVPMGMDLDGLVDAICRLK
ncbi:energy-coupling factor transporter ATPase [Christensenella sp. MSJ-20]|uniref:energy-coupling factor transporter ATPase n=1 Tax=Christensenella sp. MSJ-20 TaxID=2841518 RepID=UPI001C778866|nr:energy-coupling factor transporter ATPase [Christensenella sp. MSJ-20]